MRTPALRRAASPKERPARQVRRGPDRQAYGCQQVKRDETEVRRAGGAPWPGARREQPCCSGTERHRRPAPQHRWIAHGTRPFSARFNSSMQRRARRTRVGGERCRARKQIGQVVGVVRTAARPDCRAWLRHLFQGPPQRVGSSTAGPDRQRQPRSIEVTPPSRAGNQHHIGGVRAACRRGQTDNVSERGIADYERRARDPAAAHAAST